MLFIPITSQNGEDLVKKFVIKSSLKKCVQPILLPFCLLATLFLQGCSSIPSGPWIQSTYKPLPPLRLDVVSVDVEKEYIPPEEPPFVDHRFDTPPVDMIEAWARRYLLAAGRVGRAVVKIQEASVVEHIEERGRGQSIPYTGRIVLKIEFYGSQGEDQGFTQVTVVRTHYIPLALSEPDRQRAWKAMIEQMFATLEPLVQQNIYQHAPNKLMR